MLFSWTKLLIITQLGSVAEVRFRQSEPKEEESAPLRVPRNLNKLCARQALKTLNLKLL